VRGVIIVILNFWLQSVDLVQRTLEDCSIA
jgi:hypothetical protein